MHALVTLLRISACGTLEDSGEDHISCSGGVEFWMAAEHKGTQERTETALVSCRDGVPCDGREVWICSCVREKEQCDRLLFYHHKKGKYSGSE